MLRRAVSALLLAATALPAAAADTIWPTLADDFQLAEHYRHPQVQRWVAAFKRRPHNAQRLLARSRPVIWHLMQRARLASVPAEIALLPAIESGFHLDARSSQRAAGLWQFRAPTARQFGLSITDWYDGRYDPIRATDAALRYLTYLNDLFDNWLLAVAAYNAGEGSVRRAIAKAAHPGAAVAFWDLPLPSETSRHVPRWLALSAIVDDPKGHGIELPDVPGVPMTAQVTLDYQTALVNVAKLSGAPLKRLQKLNPGLRRDATDPDGPHELLLDAEHAGRLQAAIAAGRTPRLSYRMHRVASGDTLSQLAEGAGTTVKQLRQLNRLASNRIRIGRELLMPVGLTRPSTPRKPLPDGPDNHHPRVHTVAAGESLWTIARRYDTSVRMLARWNRLLASDTLRVGRELVIWVPSA